MVHQAHGAVRTMTDSTGGKSIIDSGMDEKASAPIKKAQCAVEEATAQGVLWPDLMPGKENPTDLCTKSVGTIGEFQAKNGILCGPGPHLTSQALSKYNASQLTFFTTTKLKSWRSCVNHPNFERPSSR